MLLGEEITLRLGKAEHLVERFALELEVDGVVRSQAVYVAIAINLGGMKEVLGLWVGQEAKEGAIFWLAVLNLN